MESGSSGARASENEWSQENATKIASELKDNLETLIEKHQSCGEMTKNCTHLSDMCVAIRDLTCSLDKQLYLDNEAQADYYEMILQAAFDLNIHSIMFDTLKSCCVLSPQLSPTCHVQTVDVIPSRAETLEICLETVSLLATGNIPQTKAVRDLGITPYAETLAIQEKGDKVSCYGFKILTAFMYDDDEYGKEICQSAVYYDRSNTLLRNEDVQLSQKESLIDFLKCNMYFLHFFVKVRYLDWPIRMSLSAGSYLAQQDDSRSPRKVLKLLEQIFSYFTWEIAEKTHKKAFLDAIYSMSESVIPALIAHMRSSDPTVVVNSLLALNELMRRERDFNPEECDASVHCAVSNGFINHALALFRCENSSIIESVLLTLYRVIEVDDIESFGAGMLDMLVPDLCELMTSGHFYVAVRTLNCVNEILRNIEYEELKEFTCNFIHENLDIVPAMLTCLSNAKELVSTWIERDSGWVEHKTKIFSHGVDGLERLITAGMEDGEEIAVMFSKESSLEKLERFKEACKDWDEKGRMKVTHELDRLNDLFATYEMDAFIDINIECEVDLSDRGDNPYGRWFDTLSDLENSDRGNSDQSDDSD